MCGQVHAQTTYTGFFSIAVTIQFDEGEYTVSEDAGMFVATVTKTGESEIPLEVTVDLIPIQAIGRICCMIWDRTKLI